MELFFDYFFPVSALIGIVLYFIVSKKIREQKDCDLQNSIIELHNSLKKTSKEISEISRSIKVIKEQKRTKSSKQIIQHKMAVGE